VCAPGHDEALLGFDLEDLAVDRFEIAVADVRIGGCFAIGFSSVVLLVSLQIPGVIDFSR
jgi:hypothetical protein